MIKNNQKFKIKNKKQISKNLKHLQHVFNILLIVSVIGFIVSIYSFIWLSFLFSFKLLLTSILTYGFSAIFNKSINNVINDFKNKNLINDKTSYINDKKTNI